MRYIYGINGVNINPKGRSVSATQLASLIQRDVSFGKWNIYEGGNSKSKSATCRYEKNGFKYHEELIIHGTKKEFKKLEKLLKGIIEVIPRTYN